MPYQGGYMLLDFQKPTEIAQLLKSIKIYVIQAVTVQLYRVRSAFTVNPFKDREGYNRLHGATEGYY